MKQTRTKRDTCWSWKLIKKRILTEAFWRSKQKEREKVSYSCSIILVLIIIMRSGRRLLGEDRVDSYWVLINCHFFAFFRFREPQWIRLYFKRNRGNNIIAILSVNEEMASTARNVIFKKRITLVFDPLLCYSLYPSLLKSFIYMWLHENETFKTHALFYRVVCKNNVTDTEIKLH